MHLSASSPGYPDGYGWADHRTMLQLRGDHQDEAALPETLPEETLLGQVHQPWLCPVQKCGGRDQDLCQAHGAFLSVISSNSGVKVIKFVYVRKDEMGLMKLWVLYNW